MSHAPVRTILFGIVFLLFAAPTVLCETVILKNGSALEGKVSLETPEFFVLQLESGGVLRVDKRDVDQVERSFAMQSAPEVVPPAAEEASAPPAPPPAASAKDEVAGASSSSGSAAASTTSPVQEEVPLALSPTGQQLLRDMVHLMQYRNQQIETLSQPGGINRVKLPGEGETAARDRVLETLLKVRGASASPPPPQGGVIDLPGSGALPPLDAAAPADFERVNAQVLQSAQQVAPAW